MASVRDLRPRREWLWRHERRSIAASARGYKLVGNSPEEFRQYMLADLVKQAKLVKESGAKLN